MHQERNDQSERNSLFGTKSVGYYEFVRYIHTEQHITAPLKS